MGTRKCKSLTRVGKKDGTVSAECHAPEDNKCPKSRQKREVSKHCWQVSDSLQKKG